MMDAISVGHNVFMRNHATFKEEVRLVGAKIADNVEMETSTFAKEVSANHLKIGLNLIMNNHANFGANVDLSGAEVGGDLAMNIGTKFDRDLDLVNAKIGGDLRMNGSSFGGEVNADSLKINIDLLANDHSSFGGELNLHTSNFADSVNANFLSLGKDFVMTNVTVGGDVSLENAKIGGDLRMWASTFTKSVNANSLSVGKDLIMTDHATIGGDLDLNSANVGGNLNVESSTIAGSVDLNFLAVGKDLDLSNHAKLGGDVDLETAKIGGNLFMNDASSFSKKIKGDSVSVGKDLMMDNASFDGNVDFDNAAIEGGLWINHAKIGGKITLVDAKIGGTLSLSESTFSDDISADRSRVGGSLLMRGKSAFNGTTSLRAVKIGSNLQLTGSSFAKTLDGTRLSVDGRLLMDDGASFRGKVFLNDAKIGEAIELKNATVFTINLSEADGRELLISGLGWWCVGGKLPTGLAAPQQADPNLRSAHWKLGDSGWRNAQCDTTLESLPTLLLLNAHFEAFQDSVDAWPPSMKLEGFHYERLGGFGGDDMRQRSSSDWSDWLERDRIFSTQPYTQLSSVLLGAGRRSASEAIQMSGRDRERDEAWKHESFWSWLRHSCLSWLWLTVFSVVAGYGIGLYTFRVLWWVLGLTLLGAVVLYYSPPARRRSFVWRLGASLHRLLPVVELSKEFKDFFENPLDETGASVQPRGRRSNGGRHWQAGATPREPRNLNKYLAAYFALQAIAGWILGFFLLAAMGTLTQKG